VRKCVKKENSLEEEASGGVKQKIQGFGDWVKDLCTYLLKNRGASFSPSGLFKNS
jgi:hypothetical protein